MMRVTRIDEATERPSLRVEGHLTHQTAEELRMECEAVLASHGSLDLDVSGLRFADATGVALLLRLERAGTRLERRSGLVDALLQGAESRQPTTAAPPDADATLVDRLRAGDPQAFETLVREHGGRMLAVARRVVSAEDDARDVVQEALLSAFRSIRSFEGTARLSTWLHRIVVNAGLMKLRSRRRRREDSIDDLLPHFDEDGHFAEPVTHWDAHAETLLERRETRDIVRRAIDRLPDNYRIVLILRDIEELDTDETAAALGIMPNAVKTRLHRARQALRTLLERGHHDLERSHLRAASGRGSVGQP